MRERQHAAKRRRFGGSRVVDLLDALDRERDGSRFGRDHSACAVHAASFVGARRRPAHVVPVQRRHAERHHEGEEQASAAARRKVIRGDREWRHPSAGAFDGARVRPIQSAFNASCAFFAKQGLPWRIRASVIAAVLVTSMVSARSARADGAFPDEFQVLLPHDQPHTILLGTNFGLLRSDDDGQTWTLVCESLVTGGDNVLAYQLGADDALYAAYDGQVVRSIDDGCSWTKATGLVGDVVTDLFADPVDAQRLYALVAPPTLSAAAQAYVSTDGATSFSPLLPPDAGYLVGIESASNAPRPLYLSTVLTQDDGGPLPAVLALVDGGLAVHLHPELAGKLLGIAHVDVNDANTIFFRVYQFGSKDDALVVSHDGAVTLTPLLSPGVELSAFVEGEDGALYTGSRTGKLWVEAPDAGVFTEIDGPHVRCLGERAGTLFVCGDDVQDGYALASSSDRGATLGPVLIYQRNVNGLAACEPAQTACQGGWESFEAAFGLNAESDGGTPAATNHGCGCGADTEDPLEGMFAAFAASWLRRRRQTCAT